MTHQLERKGILPIHIYRLCLLLLIAVLCGCTNTQYHQDYRESTDFSQFKTYTWNNISSEIAGLDHSQIQALADRQLTAQGYVRSATDPDMLLDMTIVSRIDTGSSTGLGLSIGLPIGRHGSIGLGGGKSLAREKQEGVILLDITDSRTHSLIWRGSAEAIPIKYFSLHSEQKLGDVINKLLAQFPPK